MTKTETTRVKRSTEEAKATYDSLSRYYDWLAASEKKYIDIGLRQLAAQPGEQILEIGFGTGYALLALARAVGASGKVCGIDISAGMYQVATKKLSEAGLLERVELKLGDARALEYDAGTFDGILMSFTLELFDTPDIPLVLAACRRVLRGSGRLCVVALSKDAELGLVGRLYEWLHGQFPAYIDCRPIPVQQVLQEAGFEPTAVEERSMWGLPVEVVLAR
jgi:demethylmenaquinone methyltransferase/2-methoxy-6-polyprenyl-1,4-benzoquinol methylase